MRLISRIVRAFLAWTLFIFILGGLFGLLGGQRNHVAILLCDAIFVLGAGFGLARWLGRRAARREALATQQVAAADATSTSLGPGVTAVTLHFGHQPVQVPVATAAANFADPVAEPPLVADQFDRQDIPGARGARMALAGNSVASTAPGAIAVSYEGVVKVYVTRAGWEPVGEFSDVGTDDPEYRLIAMMGVYAQNVLLGYEPEYTDADALAWALSQFVPLELLERDLPNPQQTATQLGLPVGVLAPENLRGLQAAIAARNAQEAAVRRLELEH